MQEIRGESVTLAYVDQDYTGEVATGAAAGHRIALKVIKLPEAKHGFALLPRRQAVKRSFGQTEPNQLAEGVSSDQYAA